MTKVKICGLFRPEDILAVNEAKPDYAGFILNFPKSHRSLTLSQAEPLVAMLDCNIRAVGVFVDQPMETVVAAAPMFSVIQLHGQEDNEYIDTLRRHCPQLEVWKAFKIRTQEDIARAATSTAQHIVLDNGYGTGETFDWTLLAAVQRPFFLAGGLQADNLQAAMENYAPYGVDISSGAETQRKKDREKIHVLVQIVRQTERSEER